MRNILALFLMFALSVQTFAAGPFYIPQPGPNTAVNIDGGAIDGTTVGSSTPAAGAFTTLAASGTSTLTGDLTATSATASKPAVTLTNTNADANSPTLTFYKNTASPATGDDLAIISADSKDSSGNVTTYSSILLENGDPTNTSEDGKVSIRALKAGSTVDVLKFDLGEVFMEFVTSSATLTTGNVNLKITIPSTSTVYYIKANTGQ